MNNIIKNLKLLLDNNNFRYDTVHENSNILQIKQQLKNHSSITFGIYVMCRDDEEEFVHLLGYGVGQCNQVDEKILSKLNELNDRFRWFRFHLESDKSDGTILMDYDFYVPENYTTLIIENIARMLVIADQVYPEIMQCLWG